MCTELRARGYRVSENRVARLMRIAGVRGSIKKRYRVPGGERSVGSVAANVLDRQFTPDALNQVWAGDITYIRTDEGWLYLAVVIDLCSRRVIGWSMQTRIGRELAMDAIAMAIGQRQLPTGLLHHSDRGSQYTSDDFQSLLKDHGIQCSMSGRGKLLGQCMRGELLRNAEEGTRLSSAVPNAVPSPGRSVRVHRGLLQSETPALSAGRSQPFRV